MKDQFASVKAKSKTRVQLAVEMMKLERRNGKEQVAAIDEQIRSHDDMKWSISSTRYQAIEDALITSGLMGGWMLVWHHGWRR